MLRDELEGDDVAFANEFLDRTLERLDRGILPLYAAQGEMAKALTTFRPRPCCSQYRSCSFWALGWRRLEARPCCPGAGVYSHSLRFLAL
jgi:hypothetical protein